MNVFPPINKSFYTINNEPAANLKECLGMMSREQLNTLVDNYSFDYEVFESEDQIVEFLSDRILNLCDYYFKLKSEDVGMAYLEYMPESPEAVVEDQIFSEIEDEYTKKLQGTIEEFVQFGLMFHFVDEDDYDHLVMPVELCMEFVSENLGNDGRNKFGIYSRFSQIAEILVSLYGIVPAKIMEAVWNQQYPNRKITEELCGDLMEVSSFTDGIADYYNKELVNPSIFDELYEYLKKERENKPRFIPSGTQIDVMLKMMDEDKTFCSNFYNEFEYEYNNDDYENLKSFLKIYYKGKVSLEEVLFHICFYTKAGYPLTQVVKILNEKDFLLSGMDDSVAERFGSLFKLFNETCHHWTSWGWSPRDYEKYNS
ncbi:hypothetical protein [Treponema sp.]|uniref:hypothetical protein n=1 Tax=Treponema sp. TaxID=166 RepID=UPI00298E5D19|nr:hypothetical protein [Treponema sp.]MCQ2241668.1 hypothetical protein [Treponema sp.]